MTTGELDQIALASARFWMGFDGNRQSAKIFLEKALLKRKIKVITFDLIDRYMIEGNLEEDVPVLQKLFLASIERAH